VLSFAGRQGWSFNGKIIIKSAGLTTKNGDVSLPNNAVQSL